MNRKFFVLGFMFCFTVEVIASENMCLNGVCLGDTVEKLKSHEWIFGEQMELSNKKEFRFDGPVKQFMNAKENMGSYYKAKNKILPIYLDSYLKTEQGFISKYVLGIDNEEKKSLNPYYQSRFFDNKSLNILEKVKACKGKKLTGYKITKSGNIDAITILPSPSNGFFEVVSVQRQFTKMDKPQKEKLFEALKSKYPLIMSRRELRKSLRDKKRNNDSTPVIYWDEVSGILIFSKMVRVTQSGGTTATSIKLATRAYGNTDDDSLLRNPSCSKSLSSPLDID